MRAGKINNTNESSVNKIQIETQFRLSFKVLYALQNKT